MNLEKDGSMTDLLIKKAKSELNEDQNQIDAYLKSLIRWIRTVKHLKCPESREFLLPYLRHSKYVMSKAQERIDNYCTLVKSPVYGKPEWFHRLNDLAHLKTFRALKTHVPLGYIGDDGPLVMLFRFGNYDFDVLAQEYLTNGAHMVTEYVLSIPRVQISGIIGLCDCSGMSSKMLKNLQDVESNKLMTRWFQDSVPMRLKSFLYFNEPEAFHTLFKLFSIFLSEKMKSRIKFCGKDFEKVKKSVVGIENILPEEYGGKAGKLNDIAEKFWDSMLAYNATHKEWDISVDETKREVKPSLQKYENPGAYVKTSVDF